MAPKKCYFPLSLRYEENFLCTVNTNPPIKDVDYCTLQAYPIHFCPGYYIRYVFIITAEQNI